MDAFYNLNVGLIILYVLSAFLVGTLLFHTFKFIIYAFGPAPKKKKKILKKSKK